MQQIRGATATCFGFTKFFFDGLKNFSLLWVIMDSAPVKRSRKAATFDDLPDEIIHEILRYLDLKSLKVASTVNKR